LFSFYFNYKQQLLKFKSLVAQEIPEGIVILSKDIKQCLFMNNYFKNLFEDHQNIVSQLSQFIFQEDLEQLKKGSFKSLQGIPENPRNLLNFLESEKTRNINSNSSQEDSYNLTYKRKNILNGNTQQYQSFFFESKIMPLVWDNEPAIAIILHDITEQHTILNLKIADSEKDKIIATVSHELRTPLNCILGMIQIMMKKIHDQEILRYLSICENSGDLLIALVNSLLDLHQIRANKLKLNPEKIELRKMLQNLVDLFEYQCVQKGLYLKLNISPSLSNDLYTDKNRLSQIFINLLGNSLKFTIKGGMKITAKQAQEKGFIEFTVEDTGIGIKEEEKMKLFKTFGKLEQGNECKNYQGVGLGLAISDNLVRLLGKNESIILESTYGAGSKFTFWIKQNIESMKEKELDLFSISDCLETLECESLGDKMINYYSFIKRNMIQKDKLNSSGFPNLPRIQTENSITPLYRLQSHRKCISTTQIRKIENPLSSYPTVLIVDDNLLNIVIAEKLVLSHNYNVKTAFSGQTAIDLIMNNDYAREPIKLILMDCQMPEMDGFQTTAELKRLFKVKEIPEIPIVALTANDTEEDKEICKMSGMSDYLSKPLRDKDLIRILYKYCKV